MAKPTHLAYKKPNIFGFISEKSRTFLESFPQKAEHFWIQFQKKAEHFWKITSKSPCCGI